jgi:hypothetical protein
MLHNLNDFIQGCTFFKIKVVVSLGMHGHCAESTICHSKLKFVQDFKSRNIRNNIFQMSNQKKKHGAVTAVYWEVIFLKNIFYHIEHSIKDTEYLIRS